MAETKHVFLHQLTHFTPRRFLMMLLGNVLLAVGLSLFTASALGNHPFHTSFWCLDQLLTPVNPLLNYANLMVVNNVLLFLVQLLWGRRYIGVGTVVNMFFLPYLITFSGSLLERFGLLPHTLPLQLLTLALALLLMTFGLSLVQMSDVGMSPYDAVPPILSDRTRVPFFLSRILLDGFWLVAGLILLFLVIGWNDTLPAGRVGIGTVVSVCCSGPLIHFFNRTVSAKLAGKDASRQEAAAV